MTCQDLPNPTQSQHQPQLNPNANPTQFNPTPTQLNSTQPQSNPNPNPTPTQPQPNSNPTQFNATQPNPNPNPNPIHSVVLCSQDCTQTLRKWGGNNPALFAGPTIWDIRAVYPWDGGVFLLRDPHGTILAHKKHLFLHTKHRSGVGVGHSPSNKIRLCAGSGGVCRGYILKSHFYINKTPKTFLFRAKNEAWGFPGQ